MSPDQYTRTVSKLKLETVHIWKAPTPVIWQRTARSSQLGEPNRLAADCGDRDDLPDHRVLSWQDLGFHA